MVSYTLFLAHAFGGRVNWLLWIPLLSLGRAECQRSAKEGKADFPSLHNCVASNWVALRGARSASNWVITTSHVGSQGMKMVDCNTGRSLDRRLAIQLGGQERSKDSAKLPPQQQQHQGFQLSPAKLFNSEFMYFRCFVISFLFKLLMLVVVLNLASLDFMYFRCFVFSLFFTSCHVVLYQGWLF